MCTHSSAFELAAYLDQHFKDGKSLVRGLNCREPRSHKTLRRLSRCGSRRSTLRRIVRRLVREAEAEGRHLVFNGIEDAVPEQEKIKKNVKIILDNHPESV